MRDVRISIVTKKPKPKKLKKRFVAVALDEDEYARLEREAESLDRTKSYVLRNLINKLL